MFDHWLYTPSADNKISIDKFPRITVDSKWTWLIQNDHNLDVFFNILEKDTITVFIFLLSLHLLVTRCLPYQFIGLF